MASVEIETKVSNQWQLVQIKHQSIRMNVRLVATPSRVSPENEVGK
jgi:hypothetical protein